MKSVQSIAVVAGAALFGTAVGVFSMLTLADSPKPLREKVSASLMEEKSVDRSQELMGKLARVESKIQRLELKKEAGEETAKDEKAAPEPGPDAVMESAESLRTRVDDAIAAHRKEPLDPNWAPGTMKELSKGLAVTSPLSFAEVKSVDCRTGTCSAEVKWKSRAEAMRGYPMLLQWPMRVNCERTILLPEHSAGESSVEATLLLDCNSWRADGSNLIPEESMPPLPPLGEAPKAG
jgi:hypothetical protein